jgi:predicted RecA/RadA family phage recombinase
MTALSANRETARKEGDIKSFPVYTGTAIHKGSLVMLNSTGYLIPGADTASCKFVGVAMESVTAAEVTSSGAKWVRVYRRGAFLLGAQAIDQSNVGGLCYIADDQTVEDAAGSVTNDIVCGKIVEFVSSTSCWVDIGDRVA